MGTLLVKRMMENLPTKVPIYLETEAEQNVKFYEKLGFDLLNKIIIPKYNLPLWEMEWKNE